MTNREFFTAIASNTTISAELVEFAAEAITKLDARNAARASKPSKTQVENEPIKQSIINLISVAVDGGAFASEIAEALGISVQKVSSLASQLEAVGIIKSELRKTPKKSKAKFFTLVKGGESAEDAE